MHLLLFCKADVPDMGDEKSFVEKAMADCIWTQKDAVVTGTFLFAWRQYCFKRRKVEVAFCIPWNQADGDTVIGKACW